MAPSAKDAHGRGEEKMVIESECNTTDVEMRRLVDAQLLPLLELWPTRDFDAGVVRELRALSAATPIERDPNGPRVTERFITGPPDNRRLRVLVIDPAPGESGRPAILHMHGGGYVVGTADMTIPLLQRVAESCQAVIVTVDYRLAPETRHPGPLQDNFAALKWLHAEAKGLGIDTARIAVAGESAGGGHAAALALFARKHGGPHIAFQALVYPMLDDRTGSTRRVSGVAGRYIWTAQNNAFGWTALLGVPAGKSEVPVDAVPARAERLAGLPPTWIGTGVLDLFLDENLAYAKPLLDEGVSTDLFVAPAAYHGFFNMVPESEISMRMMRELVSALRKGLAV
jgi:acetyl esterase/lipase